MVLLKVRHVLPSWDVWICLSAKYLHIDIFDENLKKALIFCVSFLYVPCPCKIFCPVRWPPAAARWKRKQEIQGSPPVVALLGDWTADWRIKSGLLRVRKIRKCAGKCHMFKSPFFYYWYRNLLFFKISHSAHTDKLLIPWIVLLDHLILNCMELLTSFKFFQGGLEIVLLSWRTFPLTDLHSAEHLCMCWSTVISTNPTKNAKITSYVNKLNILCFFPLFSKKTSTNLN